MSDDNKAGNGSMGFGIAGGRGIEFSLFDNRVAQGILLEASTTGSSQLTGAGNGTYLYDITAGLVLVGGKVLEVLVAADVALEAPADILAAGQSKVYSIVYYKSVGDDVIRRRVLPGAAATSGSEVKLTDAEIEVYFALETFWFTIGTVTIARTADTTVTEAIDNTLRPLLSPERINK